MSKQLSDEIPPKSVTHNHIGCLKEDIGQYDDAIKHYEEALRILNAEPLRKTIFILTHEATIYNNLGSVHRKLREYQKSLAYYNHALAIRMESFPPDDEDTAGIRSNIGAVYRDMGKYEKAREYQRQALEIRERILPSNHMDTVDVYSQILILHYDTGDMEKTVEQTINLMKMLPPLYQSVMSTASETFRTQLLRQLCWHMYIVHSIASRNPGRIDTSSLYSLCMQTKDINTEAEYVIRSSKDINRYPEYAAALAELEKKRFEHQNLILNQPHQKELIAIAQQDVYKAEVSLAPFVREIDFKLHMSKINADLILNKLPANSALLEYSLFYYRPPEADSVYTESGYRYCAFLLHNGSITLRYLERAARIDTTIYNAREKTEARENADTELFELFEYLIAPFGETLKSSEHLYIAPDGELYKLPFELLRDNEGRLLSERHSVSYLSSGRDLTRLGSENNADYSSAAIIADPLYDLPDDTALETVYGDDDEHRGRKRCHSLTPFKQLMFARDEAETLERVFGGTLDKRYGTEAKKDALQQLGSPNIIHIATHGFYIEMQEKPDEPDADRSIAHGMAEDPLLRCGLAFAGVNHWLRQEKPVLLKDYGDGILTGKEVLAFDLRKTNLLVLSACDTALGETKNGEGIQGLRRAFELAGVCTLLCTLWQVNDEASALLMGKYYRNFLSKGMGKLQALTEAKAFVKDITVRQLYDYYQTNGYNEAVQALAARSTDKDADKKPYAHPYYWAGYILQGDAAY